MQKYLPPTNVDLFCFGQILILCLLPENTHTLKVFFKKKKKKIFTDEWT